ncbi:Major facilitator superfamily MFS_1 [Planktothrix sp. PCC 11201]|uniref:MFS transporter n=1 Tax=Planktothrix sp. PCC 11201 TaxID=1729650 RepID=UPI00091FA2C7|nr:MFS transporter [Planktothrix sp. PCC 11201]SKB13841.1 Major facilitator superfamily MFS_1 [Planktothrix sp. PCC 11201]
MQHVSSPKSIVLFSTRLLTLYLLSLLFGIALGLFHPLMSTFMKQQQVNQIWIGINSTVYFLAIALATPLANQLLRLRGIRPVLLLGLWLMGLSSSSFPFTSELFLWHIIRVLMGFGVCFFLIGGQTALNHFSHKTNRVRVSGIYFMALGLGCIIGTNLGLHFYKISPQLAFLIGGIIVLTSFAIVWCYFQEKLTLETSSSTLLLPLLKQLKFPIHCAFGYGMAEATLITLYPVFLLDQNYSVEQMGFTLSIFGLGSLLSTVPVTNLADSLGKIKVLSACIFVSILTSLGLNLIDNYGLILMFSMLAGASIGPVYPICLALIGEQVISKDLSAGIALFTTTYSLGNAAGPILSSLMMEMLGNRFIFSAFIPLYIFLLLQIRTRGKKQLKFK